MRAVLVVIAALPACYSPELVRCTVRCSAGDTCPGDMQCDTTDHHCHDPGDTASCPVDKFTVTVTLAGTGKGLVTAMPSINCPSACTETVDYGTVVAFTATPDAASRFVGWGGACTGDTCSLTVMANDTVDANFAMQEMLTVEVMAGGNASGDVTASFDTAFDCDPTNTPCTVVLDMGTPVTLVATPANDGFSTFTGWSGDCASAGTQQSCPITLDRARTAIASFN